MKLCSFSRSSLSVRDEISLIHSDDVGVDGENLFERYLPAGSGLQPQLNTGKSSEDIFLKNTPPTFTLRPTIMPLRKLNISSLSTQKKNTSTHLVIFCANIHDRKKDSDQHYYQFPLLQQ